jgi:hypothetical protein
VLKLADVVVDAELGEVVGVGELFGAADGDDTEDEGQENTLEFAAEELVFGLVDGKVVMRELAPIEDNEDTLAVTEADIVDRSVRLAVSPEITCVIVYVEIDGPVVAAALLSPADGLDKVTVKPPVEVELPELEGDDTGIPEVTDNGGRLLLEEGKPSVAVDTKVIVIVCPPDIVLVSIVIILEIVGDAGPEDDIVVYGFETMPEGMVDVIGGLPGSVFVDVSTTLDREATG